MSGKMSDTMAIDHEIGSRIQLLRTRAGLSRKDLAESINITHQQLHKYEAGINRISASRLLVLCRVLEMSVADFFELPVGRGVDNRSLSAAQDLSMMREGPAKQALLQLITSVSKCPKPAEDVAC